VVGVPVGVLAGDCLLYWAGHRWGDRVVQSRSFRWLLTEQRLERLKAAYRRRGVVILVGARHMMGLRAAAMIGAGIVRVPFWKFLITDLAAAIPGVGVGFGLAFFFTSHIENLLTGMYHAERWGLVGLGLAVVCWLLWRRWVTRRML